MITCPQIFSFILWYAEIICYRTQHDKQWKHNQHLSCCRHLKEYNNILCQVVLFEDPITKGKVAFYSWPQSETQLRFYDSNLKEHSNWSLVCVFYWNSSIRHVFFVSNVLATMPCCNLMLTVCLWFSSSSYIFCFPLTMSVLQMLYTWFPWRNPRIIHPSINTKNGELKVVCKIISFCKNNGGKWQLTI